MLRDEGCANNNICCLVRIGRNILLLNYFADFIDVSMVLHCKICRLTVPCVLCYIAMSVFVVLHVIGVVLKAMRVVLFCRELCANRFTFLGPC